MFFWQVMFVIPGLVAVVYFAYTGDVLFGVRSFVTCCLFICCFCLDLFYAYLALELLLLFWLWVGVFFHMVSAVKSLLVGHYHLV